MDEKRIDLLRMMGYSEKAIQFIINKTNVGEMENPAVSVKNQGTCGDVMILSLRIKDDIIQEGKYEYVGCAGLQAAASALTEMIKNLGLEDASKIKDKDIIRFLNGLPEVKHECATIASKALQKALYAYSQSRN